MVQNQLPDSALGEENNSILERNRALLQYIATLADSNDRKDQFNYEFVEALIKGGAEINTTDQYGQSIFHEVARSWNVDVATFLLKHGEFSCSYFVGRVIEVCVFISLCIRPFIFNVSKGEQ